VSPKNKASSHRRSFPDLETYWSLPCWIFHLLRNSDYFSLPFSPFLNVIIMNRLCLYYPYIWGENTLFSRFHRSQMMRNIALEWMIRILPRMDYKIQISLMMKFGTLELIRLEYDF